VYQEPAKETRFIGLGTHFLSATKYLFGKAIPTYYFNLLVIWFINALLFIVLYFDLFKRLFTKTK
jgi:hypothetical protein